MKFFKRKKTIDNIFDKDSGLLVKVGSHIDKKKFTDQERRESDLREVSMIQDFVKNTLDESGDRSKSRRYVAKIWISTHLLVVLCAAVSAPFDRELAQFYLDMVTSNTLLMGTTAIIAFFFGSHLLRTK